MRSAPDSGREAMAEGQPALSVVVMGYLNESTVAASVGSVVAQAGNEVEVILVASGGDRSAEIVALSYPEVAIVDHPVRLMPGGARNLGIERARGRVVAFLAADCLVEPGWVQARLDRHGQGYPVVAGSMSCAPPRRPASLASLFLLFPCRLAGRRSGVVSAADPAAHGLSYERRLLDVVGPFDEGVLTGEDTEMAQRVEQAGATIWFEAGVRTAHTGPAGLGRLIADHYRRSRQAAWDRPVQPRLGVLALALAAIRGLSSRMSHAVENSRRNAGADRALVLAVLPWMLAGTAAGRAGWFRGQLRFREARR